jgi:hypothetical protein
VADTPLRSYLRKLERQFKLYGLWNADALAEIEDHLLESTNEGLRQGLAREQAEQRALDRFGSAHQVAAAFALERITTMQKALYGLALLAGLGAAYIDSRPNWDDTGILAFGILLAAGLIGCLTVRRPWLVGLAVGIWIPLYGILAHHNFASLLALAFALAGAYAGWALGLGIRSIFRPALSGRP